MNHCEICGLLTYRRDSICHDCVVEYVDDWEYDANERYPIGSGLIMGNGGFYGMDW